MKKYVLLFALYSALKWNELNGETKLYTDTDGYSYLNNLGLINIWNSVDTSVLNAIQPASFNHSIFWAGSKVFAMAAEKIPFCMIDLDFVALSKLQFPENECICIHKEEITGLYTSKEKLLTAPRYVWDAAFDWSVLPCNGAFVYHGNESLKNDYCNASLLFMMENSYPTPDTLQRMMFAEQRLLSMIAKKKNIEIGSFVPSFEQINLQNNFAHIWGGKSVLNENHTAADDLCARILNRIAQYFPEHYNLICEAAKQL